MNLHIDDIGGEGVKEDERYQVKDNAVLGQLNISSTSLNPGRATTGHKHRGQAEYYFFMKGKGYIEVGEDTHRIEPGDVIPIPDGDWHRVFNTDLEDPLYFVCVFNGVRSHE